MDAAIKVWRINGKHFIHHYRGSTPVSAIAVISSSSILACGGWGSISNIDFNDAGPLPEEPGEDYAGAGVQLISAPARAHNVAGMSLASGALALAQRAGNRFLGGQQPAVLRPPPMILIAVEETPVPADKATDLVVCGLGGVDKGAAVHLYNRAQPHDALSCIATVNAHDATVVAVAWCSGLDNPWSAGGAAAKGMLVTGSADGKVAMWEMGNLDHPVCVLQAHEGCVTLLEWDARAHRLISSGEDDVVTVWDLDTLITTLGPNPTAAGAAPEAAGFTVEVTTDEM
mmetsp:Transcript_38842/g.84150  ORF Transcript_38842/g.84150 Transcript_38842/m.84150 type:complete len:286 (+) Transcript_38842:44-901(+)